MTKEASAWSEQEIEMLKKLWGQGMSASQCSAVINKTLGTGRNRNAIIGKSRRLKLERRPSPIIRAEVYIEPYKEPPPEKGRNVCYAENCYELKARQNYCAHHANLYYAPRPVKKSKD